MKKYKIGYLIDLLPHVDDDGKRLIWCWWTPQGLTDIIECLEEKYPEYEYCDMITNGNGGFHEFVVLKLKQN